MRAIIEHDLMADRMKVWLWQPGPGESAYVLQIGEAGGIIMETRQPGEERGDPTFTLPRDALESLVREASGVLPPSDATVDAMRDARATRDRLLALVERGVEAWTTPQAGGVS